jgi:periplasmic protein TonB
MSAACERRQEDGSAARLESREVSRAPMLLSPGELPLALAPALGAGVGFELARLIAPRTPSRPPLAALAISLAAHGALLAALLIGTSHRDGVVAIPVEIVSEAPASAPAAADAPAPEVSSPAPDLAPAPPQPAEPPPPSASSEPPTPPVAPPSPAPSEVATSAPSPPAAPEPQAPSAIEPPPSAVSAALDAPPSPPPPAPSEIAAAEPPSPAAAEPQAALTPAEPSAPLPVAELPAPEANPPLASPQQVKPALPRPTPPSPPLQKTPAAKTPAASPPLRQHQKPAASRPSRGQPSSTPAPSAVGAAGAAASKADVDSYRAAVFARIAAAVHYPDSARERGAEGVAAVSFAFDAAGRVTSESLTRSSGDATLDDDALASVRRASPLPAPPAGAPHGFTAPIRYRLR